MARRALCLCLLPALLLALAALLPPLAQPPEYHQFAAQRPCFGVPHCLDTLSNLPFLAAGGAGLLFLGRAGAARQFIDRREMTAYRVFFAAVLGLFAVGCTQPAANNPVEDAAESAAQAMREAGDAAEAAGHGAQDKSAEAASAIETAATEGQEAAAAAAEAEAKSAEAAAAVESAEAAAKEASEKAAEGAKEGAEAVKEATEGEAKPE